MPPKKLPSPEYTAVIVWLPITNVEVVNVAWPPLMAAVPSVMGPSLNVTVPVAPAVTVAVKVTEFPYKLGFNELISVVVLLAWFTVCVRTPLILPAKLPSPL